MSTSGSQREESVSVELAGSASPAAALDSTTRLRVMRDKQRAANQSQPAAKAVVPVDAAPQAVVGPPSDDRVVSFAEFMSEFEQAYESIVAGRRLMGLLTTAEPKQFVVGVDGCMVPVASLGLTADAELGLREKLLAIAHGRLRESFRVMTSMSTLAFETMTREVGDQA